MNKKLLVILVASLVLIAAGAIWLMDDRQIALAKDGGKKFQLPANIVQVADDVYSLGAAFDKKSGEQVEGYAFIHRKDGVVKPGAAKTKAIVCYGFLAKDAKWKVVEPWIVSPANSRGLDTTFVFENLAGNIAKWENAAMFDILGDGIITDVTLSADTVSPDSQNEIYFADIADSDTIAITIVWGVFGGPSFNRRLVEWDQVYDDATFDWSMAGEPEKMDFENIATHEIGHSVGMGDLYNSSCTGETMYGYAAFAETIKRDLNNGDILGINKLY